MAMTDDLLSRDGWEIPGSDDEMEYDLSKFADPKLTACFDILLKQKTLKFSPAVCGRQTLPPTSLHAEPEANDHFEQKPQEEEDGSMFDTFDYQEEKGFETMRKRGYPASSAMRQPASKKATLGNVMNNMMRHKQLEAMGARPQMVKNSLYSSAEHYRGPAGGGPGIRPPIARPAGSVAQDITQNVMAQSRSINESMASLARSRNMPLTTPQPTPLGQNPPPAPPQSLDIPLSPNITSSNAIFNPSTPGGGMQMAGNHPQQAGMVRSRVVPNTSPFPLHSIGEGPPNIQVAQQMYAQRGMPGGSSMYKGSPAAMMGPRMMYNPVNGQTVITTQHSTAVQNHPANTQYLPRGSGMVGGGTMMSGPPNKSVANIPPNMISGPDRCQIVVGQHPGGMMPAGYPNIVPNQTITSSTSGPTGGGSKMASPSLAAASPHNQSPPGSENITLNTAVSSLEDQNPN